MRLTVYYMLSILVIYVMHTVDLAIPVRQYTDQNDISERCKRRVAPSIYLGKQVMDTSSHVMQFSRLEMPYTCSLSVRAEIGYNIIMIIRLLSTESLQEACSQNPNQLIVYELGETFGGYWGHMPDVVVNNVIKNYTKFYTIKTTKTTTTTTQSPTTYTEEETFTDKILTQTMPATEKEPVYISMIVPLVNVAGNLQLSDPLHTYNPWSDIYDEDRRVCGVAKGLPHNVYVAAFSFLALLLTLLYTIYYWLKRCVPRVSEAFFIYSDTLYMYKRIKATYCCVECRLSLLTAPHMFILYNSILFHSTGVTQVTVQV